MHSYHLDLCETHVAFRTEAGPERVERAREYVEERYGRVKAQGGQYGRDRLMAMLLVSMADDLLELRERSDRTDSRLDELLQSLKENTPGRGGPDEPAGTGAEPLSR
ncbi:cell division protein ZapA [Mailhella massiliensis]|uniref:Cell division protein ZapA n=1 Tax=Mailhella massiliensis TaxID=1903261 RepID=A0A921DRJ2_9BACT|nr:cell division protein ZapA [Mailhella massiliensis]HJD97086.1 cell division protein ZapA [Mailhella massiliensis]